MSIHLNATVSSNNTINFKGKVGNGIKKYINQQTKAQIKNSIDNIHTSNEHDNTIETIKNTWGAILHSIQTAMENTHKDTKIDMHRGFIQNQEYMIITYKNQKINSGTEDSTFNCIDAITSTIDDLLKNYNDKKLFQDALEQFNTDARNTHSIIGKLFLKKRANKLKEFANEIKLENISEICEQIDTSIKKASY